MYKGGLSIRTPLNSIYQIEALKALREGLEEYDKRHGWRGPVTSLNIPDWQNNIHEFILDKGLDWKLAKVVSRFSFFTVLIFLGLIFFREKTNKI